MVPSAWPEFIATSGAFRIGRAARGERWAASVPGALLCTAACMAPATRPQRTWSHVHVRTQATKTLCGVHVLSFAEPHAGSEQLPGGKPLQRDALQREPAHLPGWPRRRQCADRFRCRVCTACAAKLVALETCCRDVEVSAAAMLELSIVRLKPSSLRAHNRYFLDLGSAWSRASWRLCMDRTPRCRPCLACFTFASRARVTSGPATRRADRI